MSHINNNISPGNDITWPSYYLEKYGNIIKSLPSPSFEFLFPKVIAVNNILFLVHTDLLPICITQWYAGKHWTTSSVCPQVSNSQVNNKSAIII